MNKKEQEIHSNQSTSQEVTNYTSTRYSNSRLSVQTLGHPLSKNNKNQPQMWLVSFLVLNFVRGESPELFNIFL